MKIVALTDIHGAYARAVKILERELPDVAIVGGDLTNVGSVKEAEAAIAQMRAVAPVLFCVAGNMDLPQHDDLFERLDISLNGRGIMHSDIGFFGVSSAPHSPLRTPYEITEEELARRIMAGFRMVRGAKHKIFVPHAPPYGTRVDIIHSGIHVGSMAVRESIEDLQPDIVVCGHIHEAWGQDHIGASRIVNCGPAMKGHYCVIGFSGEFTVQNKNDGHLTH